MLSAALAVSCGNNRQSTGMQDEIDKRYEAIGERRQQALKAAEEELAVVSPMLDSVKAEHDRQYELVMERAAKLNDQSPEVMKLNRLRARRDSIQARFNVLCEKIKYIHRKADDRQ